MTPQRAEFEKFYDARAQAHRQTYGHDQLWDRYTQPSVVISVILIVATVAYQRYGAKVAPEGLLTLAGNSLWDGLVYMMPQPVLEALDNHLNPTLFPNPNSTVRLDTHAAKSEAMRRVLGLDRSGGGMMATVFQARTRAFSATGSALGLKVDSDRPPGLGNRDNSCYQNSILQSLASLKSLPDYLSSCLDSAEDGDKNKEVAQTLRTLVSDLNDASNNGRTLWTPSLLKSMSTWTQQDAQEYFSKVLDDIDKGIAKTLQTKRPQSGFEGESTKDETSASQHSDDSGYQSQSSISKSGDVKSLRNPLEGLLAQRVACVQCGYSEGLSLTPFNCLTLSLGLDRGFYDLHDRMNAYSKLEMIEGVECPRCTLLKAKRLLTRLLEKMQEGAATEEKLVEPRRRLEAVDQALEDDDFDDATLRDKCKITSQSKVTTTKTKQIVIARPPQSLVVHMNRSVFDPSTFDMMKNSAPVRFPLTLDLGPWCLGSAEASDHAADDGSEQWQINANTSMIAGDEGTSRLTGPIYELKAAVTHSGRHENGHYICYRKYPRHEKPQKRSKMEIERDGPPEDDVMDGANSSDGKAGAGAFRKGEPTEWWRLSDHNVSKVDESTVMSLSPGVFMLFYDCIDPSMVLQTRQQDLQDASESPTDGTVKDKNTNDHGEDLEKGADADSSTSISIANASPNATSTGIPIVEVAPSASEDVASVTVGAGQPEAVKKGVK
ncbi:ubiquitin C-terminal hydrolase [Paramyrothecium foliicola]|nr:ubiquitin C-terminal hydrolase [Paramyrothecium foliicola]